MLKLGQTIDGSILRIGLRLRTLTHLAKTQADWRARYSRSTCARGKDPSHGEGFRLEAQTRPKRRKKQILRLRLRISPADSRSACPFGELRVTPAKRLKMQRGTFEGSLAVRSIRKRPDARHFVWHGLMHPLCHSIVTGNKELSRAAGVEKQVGIPCP